MNESKGNPKFDKAKLLHQKIEVILLECQEFEATEEYPDIVDGLTRVLKSLNLLKIKYIKDLQNTKI